VLLPADMLSDMSPWSEVPRPSSLRWDALTWDSIAYFYPARLLLGQSLRNGELPLWNPHQMCGTPFLANYQSAVLYPPNWLFGVIPAARAFGILAALHLFALGAFTFLFLRSLSLGRIASTFGAIAFMLSGFAIAWLELPVFLSTGVWLPLALFFINKAHMPTTHRTRYAALAGVALGLSMLGGHPQIAFYVFMAVALYWAYLAIANKQFPWAAILTFGIGLGLAAPQLLPAMELAKLSHRGGAPTAAGYAAYSALAMPWRNLLALLFPSFYSEFCGYVGVLPLIFAFFAFTRKSRQSWFFGGLGVLALLMALGTGINRLFYLGIPGFSHSGSPARALFLFMFSAAVLGGIGLERLLNTNKKAIQTHRRLLGLVMVGGLAAILLAFGMWYNPTSRPSEVYPPTALTDSLKTNDFSRIMPLNDQWSLWTTPNAVLPPNSAWVYGLYDVQGYDPFYPVRYKALLDAAGGRDSCPQENGNMVFARNPESPVYDLLGVRWIVDHDKIRRNPDALPRAFIVHAIEYCEDQEILRRITLGESDLRSVALVDVSKLGKLDAWQRPSTMKPAVRDLVSISGYTNNSVALRIAAAKPGVLVLTDQYYPGWTAKLDGKPVHIERVDYAFRGVVVLPGEHTVTFTYSPQPFKSGLKYAATALIYLIFMGINAFMNAVSRT